MLTTDAYNKIEKGIGLGDWGYFEACDLCELNASAAQLLAYKIVSELAGARKPLTSWRWVAEDSVSSASPQELLQLAQKRHDDWLLAQRSHPELPDLSWE